MEKIVTQAMETVFRKMNVGIIGMWLMVLYPVLLWIIIGMLSAYGFQEKIAGAKISEDKSSISIPTVISSYKEEQESRKQVNALNEEKAIIEAEERRIKETLAGYDEESDRLKSETLTISTAIIERLKDLYPEDSKPIVSDDYEEKLRSLMKADDTDSKIQELSQRYEKIDKRNNELLFEYKRMEERRKSLSDEKTKKEDEIKNAKQDAADKIQKNGVGDLISELDYMGTFGFTMFATMPSQLMTIILTLSMGVLGSLISITLDYFAVGADRPFSWYLFRPFLGMVTAIAIFILVKAGQITISNASAAQSLSENLNPFIISFLGIISGIVSEQATAKIRTAGQVVFRTDEKLNAPDRWAVGIKKEMDRQKKSPGALLPFVDVSEDTIEEWITESDPVPAEAQRVIAAWLGIPARQLFTDIGKRLSPDGTDLQPTTGTEEQQPPPDGTDLQPTTGTEERQQSPENKGEQQ